MIAEKPSVARSLAEVVGAKRKEDGYLEGGGYCVTWCFGHLVEQEYPDAYDERYKKWDIADLPIIPSEWKTRVVHDGGAKKQFATIKKLMGRSDIESLVEATDAGREGELIFRMVYDLAGCTKPFERLWVSSNEPSAIKEALASMKDGHEYDGLGDAAYGRSRADWLYGISLTRLYSAMYAPYGVTYNCGRVQTPTIAMIADRYRSHTDFEPVPYWNVHACFDGWRASARYDDKAAAEKTCGAIPGTKAVVRGYKSERKTKGAPRLYDLTTLQSEANRYLGYSAQQTLDAVQELYEERLATYPRTDSNYITHDMEQPTNELIRHLLGAVDGSGFASSIGQNAKRLVNDAKVTDHHAILPTREVTAKKLASLNGAKRDILLLIVYRLFCAVGEKHAYQSTKAELEIAGEGFEATGKRVIENGWMDADAAMREAIGLKASGARENGIPELSIGDEVTVESAEMEERQTEPPKLYTEDTLLTAMITCGKAIEDEDMREAMKDSGIGTPATRANIIEGIIRNGFVKRQKKNLVPTQLAFDLLEVVDDTVKSPELTGRWEKKLNDMAKGAYHYETFMREVEERLRDIVEREKAAPREELLKNAGARRSVCKCPKCGEYVVASKKSYLCSSNKYKKGDDGAIERIEGCGFSMLMTVASKKLSEKQAVQIMQGKTVKASGMKSAAGKSFEAGLRLDAGKDGKIEFVFEKKRAGSR